MKEKTRNILVGLIAVMLPLLALGQEEASEPATPFASKVVVPEVPYEFSSSEEKEVTVLFRLNADGRPLDLEVESAPSRAYADSVREAVRRCRSRSEVDQRPLSPSGGLHQSGLVQRAQPKSKPNGGAFRKEGTPFQFPWPRSAGRDCLQFL